MKIVVLQNECCLVYRQGLFLKALGPGLHRISIFLGDTYEKYIAYNSVKLKNLNPKLLMDNPDFSSMIASVDVPDDHIALHFVDGKIHETLTTGEYFYWNVLQNHTFQIFDMSKPETDGVDESMFLHIPIKFYTKVIVQRGQCALVFYKGQFYKLLKEGTHFFWSKDINIPVYNANGLVSIGKLNPKMLMENEEFASSVLSVNVPDLHIGIHYVDDKIFETITTGEYFYWNLFEKHTFQFIDTTDPEIKNISAEIFDYIPAHMYTKIEVVEGECALLYYDGSFEKRLESGTYFYWNTRTTVHHHKIDLRVQQIDVLGQEILTSDKVGLRINFVFSYQVKDPVKLVGKLKNNSDQIYSTVQLALRKHIGQFRLDELLEQRYDIADAILEKLRNVQDDLYIEFHDAGIKDIILPGEISGIMNTVLVAEKTAQANVISRREEVASTRSLLNTAKLLDENETLRRLKELEYLERICDKVGTISVSNGGNLLQQLQDLVR